MKSKINRLINTEEYVLINGINQYLYHRGNNYNNPVLLFLHGGPGSAESIFAHAFQEKWEETFTVVHWDQRGSGKTLIKNKNSYPTIDIMIQDLYEVIQYLKKEYKKDKIILLGHSWGSVLGTTFIKQYPEEVAYYIGVGQVVGMLENERVGYEKVKELIIQAKDKKSLRKLERVGEYPGAKIDGKFMKKCGAVRKIQGKYNLAVKMSLQIFLTAYKSPIFKFSDIIALPKGVKANEKVMEYLGAFDLKVETRDYKVPMYYILGSNDWQTPYVIAKEYFETINAPRKDIYLIPEAGHMTMIDQPASFFDALIEINNKEELSENDVNDIKKLVDICNKKDNTDLKFYFDKERKNITKFLFYDEENVIAYFGVTPGYNIGTYYAWGTIHPQYRTIEKFLEFFQSVKCKCKELNIDTLKFINERDATSIGKFVKCIGGKEQYSTYTMNFNKQYYKGDCSEYTNIVLSRASLDDLNDIVSIGMEAFGTTEEDEKSYNESNLNDSKCNNFICKVDNIIVGIVSVKIHKDEGSIADLAVLKSYRKRGIGRAILAKTIDYLLSCEIEKINLSVETENKNALLLYENTGFRTIRTNDCYEIKI